jgi:hypothetical protein
MSDSNHTTHEDLLPKHTCPALSMKHILTQSMADVVYDDRLEPGDGYYWCQKTCTPIGPDDELVTPKECSPNRNCYDGPRP